MEHDELTFSMDAGNIGRPGIGVLLLGNELSSISPRHLGRALSATAFILPVDGRSFELEQRIPLELPARTLFARAVFLGDPEQDPIWSDVVRIDL